MNDTQIQEMVAGIRQRFPAAAVERRDEGEGEIVWVGFQSVTGEDARILVYPGNCCVFAEPLAVFESYIVTDDNGLLTLTLPSGATFHDGETDDATPDGFEGKQCVEWWGNSQDPEGFMRLVYGLASIAAEHYMAETFATALARIIRGAFNTASVSSDADSVRVAFQRRAVTVRVALESVDDTSGLAVVHMFPYDAFPGMHAECELTTQVGAGEGVCASRFFSYTDASEREGVLSALIGFTSRAIKAASLVPPLDGASG
jgi:hypothetical protein